MQIKNITRLILTLLLICISCNCFSQDWRDSIANLVYTPKYFGPNAFPIPEVHSGTLSQEYEVELRYDFHDGKGDKTQDVYGRVYLPFGNKAALEVSGVIRETYETTEEVRIERSAACTTPSRNCRGDVIVTGMFQALKSEKYVDAMLLFGLKTASGNLLSDARYTDAASYWFSANIGKDIFKNQERNKYVRLSCMMGFYCYMTNNIVHRQNDAWIAGGGIQSRYRNFFLDADIRGFEGYWSNGDQPLLLLSKLKYKYSHHSVYFRYQYGVHDYPYQTFSGGYIFSF